MPSLTKWRACLSLMQLCLSLSFFLSLQGPLAFDTAAAAVCMEPVSSSVSGGRKERSCRCFEWSLAFTSLTSRSHAQGETSPWHTGLEGIYVLLHSSEEHNFLFLWCRHPLFVHRPPSILSMHVIRAPSRSCSRAGHKKAGPTDRQGLFL